jgi:DNA repair protein RecN (Recombination protein N)
MLEELVVKDYALIDRLSVHYDSGLNILTGETGAGKSIIIGALSFLLGGKADVDSIRVGSDEMSVSASVSFAPDNADATLWLASRGIESEDGRVVLRRNLKRNGRGGAYVQDALVTRNELAEFTSLLFDIHGQHEHQALLRPESHRRYLDRFAGIEAEVVDFGTLFAELTEKKKAYEEATAAEKGRDERMELLRFAIDEIAAAKVKSGESASLEAEAKRLSAYEKLASMISAASSLLIDDDASAIPSIRKAKAQLESAAHVDEGLADLAKRVSDLFYEAEDTGDQLRKYRDSLSFDPGRLEEIEERLALLFKLKKKYGGDEDAVIAYSAAADAELDSLGRVEEDRAKLEKEISVLERDVSRRAADLSAKRSAAAEKLGERIAEILATLGMPKAVFRVVVKPKGDPATGRICGPYGTDDVQFLIAPNLGEPLRELVRIASGGELSRVMLAIKTVLAKADTVETLVFDEIDTGIGGEVALSVGEHLKTLGRGKQIFCITHLATIAVRADNHFKVAKRVEDGRTTTNVSVLTPHQRREEIARMLAGDSAGGAALAHADELLAKYG